LIMAKLQLLETFSLQETEDGYRLLVSAVGGEALYVSITPDQMDDIIESLEAAMGGEDEEGVEEDEAFWGRAKELKVVPSIHFHPSSRALCPGPLLSAATVRRKRFAPNRHCSSPQLDQGSRAQGPG
jgi:hypothetical protein